MPDLVTKLRSPRTLAGVFGVIGVLHFVVPGSFEQAIPRRLPSKRGLVYASGVAELVCAAGLVTEAPWAGPASAAVLLAVWPANIQMAIDATTAKKPLAQQIGLWVRVPFQLPMIHTALTARRANEARRAAAGQAPAPAGS